MMILCSSLHFIMQNCQNFSYTEIRGGTEITRSSRPTRSASLTRQCCKLSYIGLVRRSVLTGSSERTMQLLCLSSSPSSPAPGEGDTIPANRVSSASPLLFAPNPLPSARHPPRDRLLQKGTRHCRAVLLPLPPLLHGPLLSPEVSFEEARGGATWRLQS